MVHSLRPVAGLAPYVHGDMSRDTEDTVCDAKATAPLLAQDKCPRAATKPKTGRKRKAIEDLSMHRATKRACDYRQSLSGRADELRRATDNDRQAGTKASRKARATSNFLGAKTDKERTAIRRKAVDAKMAEC